MSKTEDKTGQPVVKKPESQEDKSSGTSGKPEANYGDRGTKGTGSAG